MKTTIQPITMILAALWLSVANASADGYSIVHTFGVVSNDTGFHPKSRLVQGPDGTLYGTTSEGDDNPGSPGIVSVAGLVFKIQPDGTGFTVLKYFTNLLEGRHPVGTLAISGGTLYGTTTHGGSGYGTLFKLNVDGTGFTNLWVFTGNAPFPHEGLVLSGNTLFGTTKAPGSFGTYYSAVFKIGIDGSDYSVLEIPDQGHPEVSIVSDGTIYGTIDDGYEGKVFKINTDGTDYVMVKWFTNSAQGYHPDGGLVLSGSTLYGSTVYGGSSGNGVVFKVNTDGTGYTDLHSFSGGFVGGLTFRSSCLILSGTTLYGRTWMGGSSSSGRVFKMNTDGTGFASLHDFSLIDRDSPLPDLLLSNGTLYGMTYSGGTGVGSIFKLNTNGAGFTNIFSFRRDGAFPNQVLFSGGVLYGTTVGGGSPGGGTVFKINADGTDYSVLKGFSVGTYDLATGYQTNSDGNNPRGGLVLSSGKLYGTTSYGGTGAGGTVFKVNTNGSDLTVLKSFSGPYSANPVSALVLSGNTLYGTTPHHGSFGDGGGLVFKVNSDGSGYTVLKAFTNNEGANPGDLVLSGNTLYGTTSGGGSNGVGTVFKIDTDGTAFTNLYNFNGTNGANPSAGLVLSAGTLYGTTTYGGVTNGRGTVFKINTDGTGFTNLHIFNLSDGAEPSAGLVLADGILYGTTAYGGTTNNYASGWGTVFKVDTDGANFATLYNFDFTDGARPQACLAKSGSTLYGTTYVGGERGSGVVFALFTNPLTVTLTADYTNVATGFTVNFEGTIVGQASAYYWDFGDGTVVSNQIGVLSHSWSSPGDHAVVLRAHNEGFPTGVIATITIHVEEAVRYVSLSSPSPLAPFTSWATAATNIQDAVDAVSGIGALILVSNGVYQTGMRDSSNGDTNRLVVEKPITIQSVNGPALTVINGAGEMRCVFLGESATLAGFTLTNGYAEAGGGAIGGNLSNCTLTGNSASYAGGGASYSTLNHCTLISNSAAETGGGTADSILNNCILTGNTANDGGATLGGTVNNSTLVGNWGTNSSGGTLYSTLNNCIVYYNTGGNYDVDAFLNHCCTAPLPANGVGNINNQPLFVNLATGNLRLQSNSPCVNAGANSYVTDSTDLDQRPRIVGGTVDIGAYEFQPAANGVFIGWLQENGLSADGSADYLDSDGDLMNNWQEWIAGTVPTSGSSALRLLNPSNALPGITVYWESVDNRTYFLERATNLAVQPPFLLLETNIAGQQGVTGYTDTNAIGGGPFFYRVGVW